MRWRDRPARSDDITPISYSGTRIVRLHLCWHNSQRRSSRRLKLVIDRSRLFQLFKYLVYVLLTVNVYLFFSEEWAASGIRFANGMSFAEIIEGFAASIDTAAWVVLLLMFELETYVLDDEHITGRVKWTLHGLRAICYAFIVYSFYGYLSKLLFLFGATVLPGITDLCALVDGTWAYAVDLDEYETLSAANCAAMSSASSFVQFPNVSAAVDTLGYRDIVRLAWVDVINSAVWLLVVMILETDVRLQERDELRGIALRLSTISKYILYSLLLLAAILLGVKGRFRRFLGRLFVADRLRVYRTERIRVAPGKRRKAKYVNGLSRIAHLSGFCIYCTLFAIAAYSYL